MRLIEVSGYYFNPDRVAYLSDGTSHYGGDTQTRIHFSAVAGDFVVVDGAIADVKKTLCFVMPRP